MNDTSVKGSGLEARIEAYFKLKNYGAERNVVREGRSGAPHEIDVLATKNDGVTDVSIAIECKAWDAPIEKDVISKLSMELADLGINKGIVVSLSGWTTGAELSAKQLGIELWGRDEIRDRLGQVALAEVASPTSGRIGRGLAVEHKEPELAPRLIATARGFLGFGREDLVWIKLVWLPFFLVELDHSKARSTFLKGTVVETIKRWNLYEGLGGRYFKTFASEPALTNVPATQALAPKFQPKKLEREINDSIKKMRTLVRQSSQARYAGKLAALGVPEGTDATSVIHSELILLPFFVALLRAGGTHRLIAIDAVWRQRRRAIDRALTENVSYVVQVLGVETGPAAAAAVAARNSSRPQLKQLAVSALLAGLEYWIWPSSYAIAWIITLSIVLLIAYQSWQREQGY